MADIDIERVPPWPRVLSWAALAVALIAVGLLLASGPGTRAGWWDFRTGFRLLSWGAYAGIAAAVLGVAVIALGRRRTIVLGVLAIVLGAAAVYLPWSWRNVARAAPPIHDITTDAGNPPAFVAVLAERADAPNPPGYEGEEIAAQQRAAYPEIEPLMMAMPRDSAFTLAVTAARGMRGWVLVDQNRDEGRIEATATTPWFGFLDDVVIRVSSSAGIARVDVRSKSRLGRGDAGANANRVRVYLERLRALDPAPVERE
jgi:uncharacterized protein (DUF1499 family)